MSSGANPDRVQPPDAAAVRHAVETALIEDAARRDVTTSAIVPPDQRGRGALLAKEAGVIAGLGVAEAAFHALDPSVALTPLVTEGARVSPGGVLARVEGPLRAILSAERVALNFVQRLSGVATATARLVDAVAGTNARILDTRKTTPGLRALERYAVRCGGGTNHRFDLSSAVLVKDNHVAAARARGLSLGEAVREVIANAPEGMQIEVEVTALDELREALDAGATMVLLDNMSIDEMRLAVDLARGRATTEASGGITLETVRGVAETGVDFISVGAITHSASALDISLELET